MKQGWWKVENKGHRVQALVTRGAGLAMCLFGMGREVGLEPEQGRLVSLWWRSGTLHQAGVVQE